MSSTCFGVIYKVTNKLNDKVYIGQTVQSLNKRRWTHESRARLNRLNTILSKAINKYSEYNFIWEVIEECDSKEELDDMEYHYIMQYNSYKTGYNATLGGEGSVGYKHSEELKTTMNNFKIGTKLSKESIEKRSLKQSYSWEITYPNGSKEIIRNLNRFCRKRNLLVTCMYRVARGDRKQYKGYKCKKLSKRSRFLPEEVKSKISEANKGRKLTKEQLVKRKQIEGAEWLILYPNGNVVKIRNLNSFCKMNNLQYGCMRRVAAGDRKQHKGFICNKVLDEGE